MDNKKFQIFVSSTYNDLKEERSRIYEAILAMGHIPVGMEYFGSRSKTSETVIKSFLDQCDFQITIVGTRYGSLIHGRNISYTEMEYDYAKEIEIPQIGFIHRLKGGYASTENSTKSTQLLGKFRDKVSRHQCAFWETPDQLVVEVQRALPKEIADCDRPGWVRGNDPALSSDYQKLSAELSGVKTAIDRFRKNVVENNRQRFELNLLPTPPIAGVWQCQEKATIIELFEYAGAIISHFLTGTHEHWLYGTWSPENSEVHTQTWRRERIAHNGTEKRLTIMFGRILDITPTSFLTEVFATDGKADLKNNYSEHLTWKRLTPFSDKFTIKSPHAVNTQSLELPNESIEILRTITTIEKPFGLDRDLSSISEAFLAEAFKLSEQKLKYYLELLNNAGYLEEGTLGIKGVSHKGREFLFKNGMLE